MNLSEREDINVEVKITSDEGETYHLRIHASYSKGVVTRFGGKKRTITFYPDDKAKIPVDNFGFDAPLDKLYLKALLRSRVFVPLLLTSSAFGGIPPVFKPYLILNPDFKDSVILRDILPEEETIRFKKLCEGLHPVIFREGIIENPYNVIILDAVTDLEVPFLPPKHRLPGIGEIEIRNGHIIGLDFPHLGRPLTYSRSMLYGQGLYPVSEWATTVRELKDLPEVIGSFSHLEYLNLEQNLLSSLPVSIQKLKQLKELNLSYNMFKEFPEVLLKLSNLTRLDLSFNYLEKIPDAIGDLKNLSNINFERNNLRMPPDGLIKVIKKRFFDIKLCMNRIYDLSLFSQALADIFSRYAHDEEFFHSEADAGRDLSFDFFYFDDEKQTIMKNLPSEEREIVFDISQMGYDPFKSERIAVESNHIKKIYLSNNDLGKIPRNICQLSYLEKLYLADCGIETFPEQFSWDNLKILDLSQNRIEKIPTRINRLKNLEELDLGRNQLSYLPYDALKELTHLKSVSIGDQDGNLNKDDIIFLENLPKIIDLEYFRFKFVHQVVFPKDHFYSIRRDEDENWKTQFVHVSYLIWKAPMINALHTYLSQNGIQNILGYHYQYEQKFIRIPTEDTDINFKKIFSVIETFEKVSYDPKGNPRKGISCEYCMDGKRAKKEYRHFFFCEDCWNAINPQKRSWKYLCAHSKSISEVWKDRMDI